MPRRSFIGFAPILGLCVVLATAGSAQKGDRLTSFEHGVVVVDELNVRNKFPSLESRGFLRWGWDFGGVIAKLRRGTKVDVLELRLVAETHVWARVRFRDSNGSTRVGYVYVQRADGSYFALKDVRTTGWMVRPRLLVLIANAQGEPGGEIVGPEAYKAPGFNYLQITFVIAVILFTNFCVFRLFNLQSDRIKLGVSVFLTSSLLLVFGYINQDTFRILLKPTEQISDLD